jgi:hypothetical protein
MILKLCTLNYCYQKSKQIAGSDHQQGIICGVAFARSSLQRIYTYASVVAPGRLASNTFLVIRNPL